MTETQRQMTIKKKFIFSMIISVSFTFFSLLFYSYMASRGNDGLSSRLILISYLFGCFIGPILFVVTWSICAINYVKNEKNVLGAEENKQLNFGIYSCLAVMAVFGTMMLYLISVLMEFRIEHRLYINELSKWTYGLEATIIVCAIALVFALVIRRKNMTPKKSVIMLVVSCILFLAVMTETKYLIDNAEEEAFWIRLYKGVEFTEENGPYVENPYSFSNYRGDED